MVVQIKRHDSVGHKQNNYLFSKTSLQLPVLMLLQDVFFTYHHFASNPLTLDSNSKPLVVFALSVQIH